MEKKVDLDDIFGQNLWLVEEFKDLYERDPGLVGKSWADFFGNGSVEHKNGHTLPPTVASRLAQVPSFDAQLAVFNLIAAYRERGHLVAKISPLDSVEIPRPKAEDIQRDSDEALTKYKGVFNCAGFAGDSERDLSQLIPELKQVYAGSIGFEISHVYDARENAWLQERIERRFRERRLSSELKRLILEKIVIAETFEAELHKKYVGQKWFSLEGGETLIPMFHLLMEKAPEVGIKEIYLGMAHRGRLNILANALGKPLPEILSEFEDQTIYSSSGAGDVKYHIGYSAPYQNSKGNQTKVTLACNPSHLEFVDAVIPGMARAKQDIFYNHDRRSVLPILIHGEAAFVGQGIVWEAINLSGLKGYSTGGLVHIIINNQIGFTTDSVDSRSGPYVTDFAKANGAPVFHVNSHDVEESCWALDTLFDFRNEFGKDVILDLYCYRKYGHNEADDPSFTQPTMYSEIKGKERISQVYIRQLGEQNTLDVEEVKSQYVKQFDEGFAQLKNYCPLDLSLVPDRTVVPEFKTAVSQDILKKVSQTLLQLPDGFTPHPKLHGIIKRRCESLESGQEIDWGSAEAAAYGSLMLQDVSIRMTGQDIERGTFSHRHLVYRDYKTSQRYSPLASIKNAQLQIYNSPLSEAGVMGFDFGFASVAKDWLVIWEAQFGDFCNGAQVIIDQFLTSSESKWNQRCGLVLLLPHGFEGSGPEHSSARLERFLSLSANNNMGVCVPSNAAQVFHMLRRQGLAVNKRPLIVMSPKSLLRLPLAAATAEDLTSGEFKTTIESGLVKSKAKNLIFLSGKVYYDLSNGLRESKVTGTEVVRIEQLFPFPHQNIKDILAKHKNAKIHWVQEEPRNNGAWLFVRDHFDALGVEISYIGRPPSSSVAGGSSKRHQYEQKRIVEEVLAAVR